MPNFVLPEIEQVVAKEQKEEETPQHLQPQPIQKVQQQPQFAINDSKDSHPVIITEEVVSEIESTETTTDVAVAEVEEPAISEEVKEAVEKPTFTAVKITYIASNNKKAIEEETQKNDSTGVLKKFIAFTGKIAPGDMLADIKTAKDNLFNGGLKNKKERSSL